MSPRRHRGRPRKAWTHCQTRRLARLYSLTTLSNAEILALLEGEGIAPRLMKLRSIYPKEYVANMHDLRPRTDSAMRSRLITIRKSRSSKISKAARYSRVKYLSDIAWCKHSNKATISERTVNAFRNYHVPITQNLHKYLSQYPLRDSQPTNSLFLMLDGSTTSNQPLTVLEEPQPARTNCLYCEQSMLDLPLEPAVRLNCGHTCHEGCLSNLFEQSSFSAPVSRRCPSCNAPLALDPGSGIAPGTLDNISKRNLGYEQVAEYPISTNVSERENMEKEEKRIGTNLTANMLYLNGQLESEGVSDGIRRHLKNRSPSYIDDVVSAMRLSLSDSYRSSSSVERVASSLRWTVSSRSSWMSMSSLNSRSTTANFTQMPSQSFGEQLRQGPMNFGRTMFYRVAGAAPLVKRERDIWNEIIDESQLLPARESRPATPEKNLLDRCCPGQLDDFDKSLCSYCGYSQGWYHWYPCTDDYKTLDSFGNTKLHYAAACSAIKLSLFRILIEKGVDIRARNSSGETFMHVFKTKQFIAFQGWSRYIELLTILRDLGFPFSQRDFHGRTIAHSFAQGVWTADSFWGISAGRLSRVLEILGLDTNTLDNHGFNVGDEILHQIEKFVNQQRLDAPRIMAQVKQIVDQYRIHQRLKICFRETISESNWMPREWIKWLKELDLITWIDTHGDTPLTALLKNRRREEEQAGLSETVLQLVKLGVDVNMRDRKGNTATAIAAIRGSLSCVQALLDSGADANTINYRGRDTESIASWRMKLAKREGKTQCYARILACINLLVDSKGNGCEYTKAGG